jgi:hypothetical protein
MEEENRLENKLENMKEERGGKWDKGRGVKIGE